MKPARRVPRQARSKETADAIVEAAARVFADVGLARATTTRIADVAGVSVGSLYQYFPDKQALVTAIFERESERLEAALAAIVAREGLSDAHAVARAYVALTVDAFEVNGALYRVLLEEVPRVAGLGPTQALDLAVASRLEALLELARDRVAPRDLRVASLLIVRTVRYNTIPLLREPLDGEARARFVDELAALLCAYLFAPPERWVGHRLE